MLAALFVVGLLMASSSSWSQAATGSLNVHWNEGAKDCKANPQAPIEVHAYNPQTFILRENLCATFEAPFMYLLIGSTKALLIDTGDVTDPERMPLAKTVMNLLPGAEPSKLPLLVVHTHRHLDHRAGDGQFAHLSNVQMIGWDLDSVRRYYNFADWPNGLAQINLGDRTIDVIPTPGHNATHVVFYDRNTALLFSGDFLMPGRLLIDDADANLASSKRVAAFVKDRPVSYVLGGHIEFDSAAKTFAWESQYHPHEHALADVEGRSARSAVGCQQLQRLLHRKRQVYPGQFDSHPHRHGCYCRCGAGCGRAGADCVHSPPQARPLKGQAPR